MPNRTRLLEQIHSGTVFVGSAAVVAFLGSIFDGPPAPERRYAYETIDGMRCLVEAGSNTFIASSDGEPECTQLRSDHVSFFIE